MSKSSEALTYLQGRSVVLDMISPFVVMGTLTEWDESYYHLQDADIHDLRQSEMTREAYIAESKDTGVRPNRDRMLVRLDEVVAISALEDVLV